MTEPSPAEALFFAALEKGTPQERAAYLDAACAHDPDLRQRVERLLAAHPQVGSFLESGPAPQPAASDSVPTGLDQDRAEGVGSVLAGRYKLLEQIGEGGMGTVWVAEQTQPVRRKVAVKLIKAGMDTRVVLTRFEAERQALALMDHPNIAKVLDGGTTDTGRPFFVMEYVKGVPFTRYCDDARLSIAQRLALFVPVCQAVQHAHQKGIIHRDLKPSNVLICLYDGNPVPKVIDFGLAKAMHQPLTERTLYTAHGVMLGTPLYMSPEQAELNNLDVDTRTDIYALGVILYELLTGTTPLEKAEFQKAAWHELLRLIKEHEPPRPSARLSASNTLPSLAAQRQLEPVKLTRLVRGELDWIVMKCLEKDRSRRYDTATSLARDVERYLTDDVVEARPPSAGYRLRKFARKYRVGLVTTAGFVVLLLASAGISAFLAVKAKRAEGVAEQERIKSQTHAEKAEHVTVHLWRMFEENSEARSKAELHAAGLRVDIALGEIRNSKPEIGMLQLARFLNEPDVHVEYPIIDAMINSGTLIVELNSGPEFEQLREFATIAILAAGQDLAPLLPPITHDGAELRSSFFNPSGDRLLTLGKDQTARLWDPFHARQLTILRRSDEKVIGAGLSPDGATVFTHSSDGVIRLWEGKNGTLRAEIDPRAEGNKSTRRNLPGPEKHGFSSRIKILLSNHRLITCEDVWKSEKDGNLRPAELWDAKTGGFIARLGSSTNNLTYEYVCDGQWIWNDDFRGSADPIQLFSAEDGRLLAKLNRDKKYDRVSSTPKVSPSKRTLAASIRSAENSDYHYIHSWDTTSWQLLSTTGPFLGNQGVGLYFDLIADDQFRMDSTLYRLSTVSPIAKLTEPYLYLSQGERIVDMNGQLYDSRTRQRLRPPKGRKHHPDLALFAPDGRFVEVPTPYERFEFLDTKTEKGLFTSYYYSSKFYQQKLGWVMGTVTDNHNGSQIPLARLPPPERLDIPPDLLELWAQVAVRGHLDDEGTFVMWDEPTWEKKRQELAAKPAPYPDFPFPGHVATDRLHWLRAEFKNADEKDQPRLAKQLLDRALAAGDKTEATRWRWWLAEQPIWPILPAGK